MTRIYWADVSPLSDDVIFEAAKKALPLQRLQRLEKLKFRQDKNLCLGSWLVLSQALCGFPHYKGNETITAQKNGKPVFADNPNVHFNISHSGSVAVCAVSDMAVGVDVQLICDFKEEICRRYFGKAEADFVLSENDPAAKKDKFFKTWALKEAYSKMTGAGLGDFKNFEIDFSSGIGVKSKGTFVCVSFAEFDIPGYKTALCSNGSEKEYDFKRINLIKTLIN